MSSSKVWIAGVFSVSLALLGAYLLGANTATARAPGPRIESRASSASTSAVRAPATETPPPAAVPNGRTTPTLGTPATTRSGHGETRDHGVTAPEGVVAQRTREGTEALRVRRIEVATGISEREPVGQGARFAASTERLYVFVEMANRGDAEGQVTLSFEPEGRRDRATGLVSLEVPARTGRHRTWAWSRNVHTPGAWVAIARDEAGRELARTAFVIE